MSLFPISNEPANNQQYGTKIRHRSSHRPCRESHIGIRCRQCSVLTRANSYIWSREQDIVTTCWSHSEGVYSIACADISIGNQVKSFCVVITSTYIDRTWDLTIDCDSASHTVGVVRARITWLLICVSCACAGSLGTAQY